MRESNMGGAQLHGHILNENLFRRRLAHAARLTLPRPCRICCMGCIGRHDSTTNVTTAGASFCFTYNLNTKSIDSLPLSLQHILISSGPRMNPYSTEDPSSITWVASPVTTSFATSCTMRSEGYDAVTH